MQNSDSISNICKSGEWRNHEKGAEKSESKLETMMIQKKEEFSWGERERGKELA